MPDQFTRTPESQWNSPDVAVRPCELCGEVAYGTKICLDCREILQRIKGAS